MSKSELLNELFRQTDKGAHCSHHHLQPDLSISTHMFVAGDWTTNGDRILSFWVATVAEQRVTVGEQIEIVPSDRLTKAFCFTIHNPRDVERQKIQFMLLHNNTNH